MSDEQVIALMKSAALEGRDGTAADVAAAFRTGRRIRRRRRAVAAVGSGVLGCAAVLAVLAVVPGGPGGREVVLQPADGAVSVPAADGPPTAEGAERAPVPATS